MAEEHDDGLLGKRDRAFIIIALLLGASGNIANLASDTGDRYHGADAQRDFQLRDERTARVAVALGEHKTQSDAKFEKFAARLRELEDINNREGRGQ